ncbi:hypothetical protein HK098_002906 [Nowakowskiella sp. JEL0407]|nr:hypothetical protein HK098_004227 [Nowakowskiella sp. JEL0407]KAJ3122388.1 hypothetical protein HK098_002906 [Nowakowskiella sp. JEL0407]
MSRLLSRRRPAKNSNAYESDDEDSGASVSSSVSDISETDSILSTEKQILSTPHSAHQISQQQITASLASTTLTDSQQPHQPPKTPQPTVEVNPSETSSPSLIHSPPVKSELSPSLKSRDTSEQTNVPSNNSNNTMSVHTKPPRGSRIDPAYTPKVGHFWLHDDRFSPDQSGTSANGGGFRSDKERREKIEKVEKSDEKDEKSEKDVPRVGERRGSSSRGLDQFVGRENSLRGRNRGGFSNRSSFSGRSGRGGSSGGFFGGRRDMWTDSDESDPINDKWQHDKFEESQQKERRKVSESDRRRSWAPQAQSHHRDKASQKQQSLQLDKKKSTPNMRISSESASESSTTSAQPPQQAPHQQTSQLSKTNPRSQPSTSPPILEQKQEEVNINENDTTANGQSPPSHGRTTFATRTNSSSARGGRQSGHAKRGSNNNSGSSKYQWGDSYEKDEWDMYKNEQKSENGHWTPVEEPNVSENADKGRHSKRYLWTKSTTVSSTPTSNSSSNPVTNASSSPPRSMAKTADTSTTKPPSIVSTEAAETTDSSSGTLRTNALKKAVNAPEFKPAPVTEQHMDPTFAATTLPLSVSPIGPPFRAQIPVSMNAMAPVTTQSQQTLQPMMTSTGHVVLMTEGGYIYPIPSDYHNFYPYQYQMYPTHLHSNVPVEYYSEYDEQYPYGEIMQLQAGKGYGSVQSSSTTGKDEEGNNVVWSTTGTTNGVKGYAGGGGVMTQYGYHGNQMDEESWVTDGAPSREEMKEFEIDYELIERERRMVEEGVLDWSARMWREEEDESDGEESDVEVIIEYGRVFLSTVGSV